MQMNMRSNRVKQFEVTTKRNIENVQHLFLIKIKWNLNVDAGVNNNGITKGSDRLCSSKVALSRICRQLNASH